MSSFAGLYEAVMHDERRPTLLARLQEVSQSIRTLYSEDPNKVKSALIEKMKQRDELITQLIPPVCAPYFHLSERVRNGKVFRPRVPRRLITGREDSLTKRICFARTIGGALSGLSDDLLALRSPTLYVHVPYGYQGRIYEPLGEVPDAKHTGEAWFLNDVQLACVASIRLLHRQAVTDQPDEYEWLGEQLGLFHWSFNLVEWQLPGEWTRL